VCAKLDDQMVKSIIITPGKYNYLNKGYYNGVLVYMKIYYFKFKNIVLYCSAVVLLTILFSIIGVVAVKSINSMPVSASKRDLPIYCVESIEKKASITFDSAWGADDIAPDT